MECYGSKEEVVARKLIFAIKFFLKRGVDYTRERVDEKYAREHFGTLLSLIPEAKGDKYYENIISDYLKLLLNYKFEQESGKKTKSDHNFDILLAEFQKML